VAKVNTYPIKYKKRKFNPRSVGIIFKYIILIISSIVALYPVFWLTSISFKNKAQYLENKFYF